MKCRNMILVLEDKYPTRNTSTTVPPAQTPDNPMSPPLQNKDPIKATLLAKPPEYYSVHQSRFKNSKILRSFSKTKSNRFQTIQEPDVACGS
ncbi:hypothetical protein J6590_051459 [Homalodisca vitripennis]|nr:hypothetical protein J6590_051459 [Homalodisca vitripennis]